MDLNRIKELAGTIPADAPTTEATNRSAYVVEAMRMAGIPINEAYDDDEDPDVKVAMKDKRQQEFEKKNSKALKAAEKVAAKGDAKDEAAASKTADDEPTEETPAAEKKETPAAEKKEAAAKGRKCSERGGACRAWLTAHPEATLSQFKAHAKELGMGVGNATTTFYAFKKKSKVAEAFMVFHPLDSNTVLAENTRMRRYEWIDLVEGAPYAEPMVFDSEFEAKSIVAGVSLMGQTGNVVKVVENDEPVDW